MKKTRNFILLLFSFIVGLSIFPNYSPYASEKGLNLSSIFGFDKYLSRAESASLVGDQVYVYLDNNTAFRKKYAAIKAAKKSIRMSYYIFSPDHSSMYIAKELVNAAKRGVNIKIVVDYITNFKNIDFFKMLEREGAPNIRVRFYNRPTKNIIADAFYLTTSCDHPMDSKSCYQQKKKMLDRFLKKGNVKGSREVSNANNSYTRMFLNGLYSKNPKMMIKAIFEGQQIDFDELMAGGGAEMSPESLDSLKELGKILYRSFTGNIFIQLGAKVKLTAATLMYGEKVAPVLNIANSLLPVEVRKNQSRAKDWEYISDFTHHKILLIDKNYIQTGGRNLENSYHMDENKFTSKYTFMDTDVSMRLSKGARKVIRTFDEYFNYTRMQATVDEVYTHAVYDTSEKEDSIAQWKIKMNELSEQFVNEYKIPEQSGEYIQTFKPLLEVKLNRNSTVSYLENLHYNRNEKLKHGNNTVKVIPIKRKRLYGTKAGNELASGKAIHGVLFRALDGVCKGKKLKRIIFHNAYTLPPATFYEMFGEWTRAKKYNCSNITVQVLTNSLDTTDLSPVNIAAKYGMVAFSQYYQSKKNSRSAIFNFYEYKRISRDPKKSLSLHSKVFVIGDDIFIGSANLDPRSLMMDTNNGLYFRKVPSFVSMYQNYFDHLISQKEYVENKTTVYQSLTFDQLQQQDELMIRAMAAPYVGKNLTVEQLEKAVVYLKGLLREVYKRSKKIIKGSDKADKTAFNRFLQVI